MANSIERYEGVDAEGYVSTMAKVIVEEENALNLSTLKSDDEYTLTLYVKSEIAERISAFSGAEVNVFDVDTTWKKIVWNFYGYKGNEVNVNLPVGIYYFWHSKLEKGNISTDYTEAPEDTEETITTLSSQITQLSDSVAISIDKDGNVVSNLSVDKNGMEFVGNKLVIVTDNFSVDENGNVIVSGNISADKYITLNDQDGKRPFKLCEVDYLSPEGANDSNRMKVCTPNATIIYTNHMGSTGATNVEIGQVYSTEENPEDINTIKIASYYYTNLECDKKGKISFVYRDENDSSNTSAVSVPKKSGTIALLDDIPDVPLYNDTNWGVDIDSATSAYDVLKGGGMPSNSMVNINITSSNRAKYYSLGLLPVSSMNGILTITKRGSYAKLEFSRVPMQANGTYAASVSIADGNKPVWVRLTSTLV